METREDHISAKISLLQELNAYYKNGCTICLNGRPVSTKYLVDICLHDGSYMRDIIADSTQTIREINFIRLRNDENRPFEQRRSGPRSHGRRNSGYSDH